MDSNRYVIIRNSEVVNTVMWDGDVTTWSPPADAIVMRSDNASIGDWWEEAEQRFYRPLPVHTETVEEQHEQDI